MESKPRIINNYVTPTGREPFQDWLRALRDQTAVAKIRARITRVELDNFGNCKSVGEGVLELKIPYGPGYRIYFGLDDDVFVILLCGGDKNTQTEDIKIAKQYWCDYKEREYGK